MRRALLTTLIALILLTAWTLSALASNADRQDRPPCPGTLCQRALPCSSHHDSLQRLLHPRRNPGGVRRLPGPCANGDSRCLGLPVSPVAWSGGAGSRSSSGCEVYRWAGVSDWELARIWKRESDHMELLPEHRSSEGTGCRRSLGRSMCTPIAGGT